nr:hypothetical protein CFP56_22221 [Quercus suber]
MLRVGEGRISGRSPSFRQCQLPTCATYRVCLVRLLWTCWISDYIVLDWVASQAEVDKARRFLSSISNSVNNSKEDEARSPLLRWKAMTIDRRKPGRQSRKVNVCERAPRHGRSQATSTCLFLAKTELGLVGMASVITTRLSKDPSKPQMSATERCNFSATAVDSYQDSLLQAKRLFRSRR